MNEAFPKTQNENMERLQAVKDYVILELNEHYSLHSLKESEVTENYINWLNDREVNKFLIAANSTKQTKDSVCAFVRLNAEDNRGVLFGLFWNKNHIGNIRVHDIDWNRKSAFIGIALLDKEHWGRGVGRAALSLVSSCVFNLLGLRTIRAVINDDNTASQRMFGAVGFTLEDNSSSKKDWVLSRENLQQKAL